MKKEDDNFNEKKEQKNKKEIAGNKKQTENKTKKQRQKQGKIIKVIDEEQKTDVTIIELNKNAKDEMVLNQLTEILIESYFNKFPDEKEEYCEEFEKWEENRNSSKLEAA